MRQPVIQQLSFLDRYLKLWMVLVMVLGVALGYFMPGVEQFMHQFQGGTTNILLIVRPIPVKRL